jgi:gliding motility-associated-like protein
MHGSHAISIKAALCVVLLAFPDGSDAQQVLNGGFESLLSLPNNTGQWALAESWGNASSVVGDPDVYHIQGVGGGDLPETPVAIVQPIEGMAIAGFMACGQEGSNRREYLTGQFSESLVPGVRYQMRLAITNGERTPFSQAGLGVSDLGVFFSEESPQQFELAPLELTPNFTFSQVIYSREWQWLAFAFTSEAAYTHFTLGMFGMDDQHEFEVEEGNNPSMAYYFLDGFEILEIDSQLENEESVSETRGPGVKPNQSFVNLEDDMSWFVPNAFTPNGDGENDLFSPVLQNLDFIRLQIFNRWGDLIWVSEDEAAMVWNGTVDNGRGEASPGSYVWTLQMKKKNGQRISKKGTLNLIR